LACGGHQASRTKSTGKFVENGRSALRAIFVHIRVWGAISVGSALSINESGKSRLGYNKNCRKRRNLIIAKKTRDHGQNCEKSHSKQLDLIRLIGKKGLEKNMAHWTVLMDRFIACLADHKIILTEQTQKQSFAIQKKWTSTFCGSPREASEVVGRRAIEEFLSAPIQDYVILFLSSKINAFPVSTNQRPCSAFSFTGKPVDLSEFHELEFAVFPESYEWTIVHTHEDWSLGGPYFVNAN
jgi:hypothetical protein